MLSVQITDYTNGFSVVIYDKDGKYLVREVTETKLEALKAAGNAIIELMSKEREAILNAAMMQ